jgi:putative transposase
MMPMTEQYDPYENGIAERINRTLKYEYGFKNTDIGQQITKQAVSIYNNLRTHFSLGLRKPAEVYLNPNIKYKSYRRNNVNLPELTI